VGASSHTPRSKTCTSPSAADTVATRSWLDGLQRSASACRHDASRRTGATAAREAAPARSVKRRVMTVECRHARRLQALRPAQRPRLPADAAGARAAPKSQTLARLRSTKRTPAARPARWWQRERGVSRGRRRFAKRASGLVRAHLRVELHVGDVLRCAVVHRASGCAAAVAQSATPGRAARSGAAPVDRESARPCGDAGARASRRPQLSCSCAGRAQRPHTWRRAPPRSERTQRAPPCSARGC
jgi:hypothetical protein